jgi:hypothetical protein
MTKTAPNACIPCNEQGDTEASPTLILQIVTLAPIFIVTRSSVIGAGSNPAAALILVVLLSVLLILNTKIKENAMMKMTEETKSKSCEAKRKLTKLTMNLTHFFETTWATGVGVAAAMVTSVPINSRRVQ